jgi:hypothetical protein
MCTSNLLRLVACAALLLPCGVAMADIVVEADYQGLDLYFNPNTSFLSLSENAGSQSQAYILSNSTVIDRADILNSFGGPGMFQMLFSGAISNGGGLNDLKFLNTEFRATDTVTTLADPSLLAGFNNANITGSDVDGVTFGGGILRIEGRVFTVPGEESILVRPAPGLWAYKGESDAPIGVGADGVADQISVAPGSRDNFDVGILAVLEVNINRFVDGTSTSGLNADTLFEMALIHGGFRSDSAQLQIAVVPVPGALLLAGMGVGLVGWLKRRLT